MATIAHGKFSGRRLTIFGCGYVGAAVAKCAIGQGADVTALTRNSEMAGALRTEGVTVVQCDVASNEWHAAMPDVPDLVLNCLSAGGSDLGRYRHSYVEGMRSILRWCASRGPAKTIVYTSSTSVYPQGNGAIVEETAETADADETRPGILVSAERMLMQNQAASDRWFVLRLAGIYGPGRLALVEQVKAGVVSGVPDHFLNLAHRDDIVTAICGCLLAPDGQRSQVFNVSDGSPATKAEIARWIAARVGVARPSFSGQPASGRRSVTPNRRISNAKLSAALGWHPAYPSYREGYASFVDDTDGFSRSFALK